MKKKNNSKYKFAVFVLLFLNGIQLHAQDEKKILTMDSFLEIVRSFHPIAKQTQIALDKSDAEVLLARSNFDPVFNYYDASKNVKNTTYYRTKSGEISIPTWYGIDLYVGRENLSGDYLDRSQTQGTTNYLGINIPLVKNLVMDKRRATVLQAKAFKNLEIWQQKLVINDLLKDASEAYLNWAMLNQNHKIIKEIIQINEKRLAQIKKYVELGERAAIEITEAQTQLQNYQLIENQNEQELQNSALELSVFLWTENGTEYLLPKEVIPEENIADNKLIFNEIDIEKLEQLALENHPYLKIYNEKLNVLKIEKKLKFQDLLPKIDFTYNLLSNDTNYSSIFHNTDFFRNNFQYGLKVEIPLFLSKGRAGYKIAKYKISETQLEQNLKKKEIQTKVKTYYNDFLFSKNQVALSNQNYENYKILLHAEETRLLNGESSLFLINNRENQLYDAQIKWVKTQFTLLKSFYYLQWSAGILR